MQPIRVNGVCGATLWRRGPFVFVMFHMSPRNKNHARTPRPYLLKARANRRSRDDRGAIVGGSPAKPPPDVVAAHQPVAKASGAMTSALTRPRVAGPSIAPPCRRLCGAQVSFVLPSCVRLAWPAPCAVLYWLAPCALRRPPSWKQRPIARSLEPFFWHRRVA
jgi:hypothetical protein